MLKPLFLSKQDTPAMPCRQQQHHLHGLPTQVALPCPFSPCQTHYKCSLLARPIPTSGLRGSRLRPHLLEGLIALLDLPRPLLQLLCLLVVHRLGLEVVPCQEEVVGPGHIFKKIRLAALLVIKGVRLGLQAV